MLSRRLFMLAVLLAAAPLHATVVPPFRDGTFTDAEWAVMPFVFGNGGTITAMQTLNGHQGQGREITNMVAAAPSASTFSAIFGVHLKPTAMYDPQASGPIATIDYHEDALLITGFGDGQATGIALQQGGPTGPVYLKQVGTTPDQTWTRKEALALTAGSFVRITDGMLDGTQHPDFSASGGPIVFGFFRSNSTSVGANGYTIVAAIDNWEVRVNAPCTTPADCDDSDLCTTDGCESSACTARDIDCSDGDECTTDGCTAGQCTHGSVDCDDQSSCTADSCSEGSCQHVPSVELLKAAVDEARSLINGPICGDEPIIKAIKKKLKKGLKKADKLITKADKATVAEKIMTFVDNADGKLALAESVIQAARADERISQGCADAILDLIGRLRMCAAGL